MPNRALKVTFTGLVLALLLPAVCSAGRIVRVYETDVHGDPSGPALEDAMRRVLVRATGRLDAGADPLLTTLVTGASRYVQSSRPAANGYTHVVFDGDALEQAIASAGRSVWEQERPFTLVVFNPPLSGAAAEAARVELDKAAEIRGLPVTMAPVPVVDANGVELPREAILQGARRLGGDAVLIARGDSGALTGVWQWTLHTPFSTENWTGALDAGINGAVDAFARVQDTSTYGELETFVQVGGVTTLNDYAAVSRLLESIPGTRRVSVFETNGGTATFSVLVRGGAEAVDRALSGSTRLSRVGAANAQLVYEYSP
jgi:hypothetical protein